MILLASIGQFHVAVRSTSNRGLVFFDFWRHTDGLKCSRPNELKFPRPKKQVKIFSTKRVKVSSTKWVKIFSTKRVKVSSTKRVKILTTKRVKVSSTKWVRRLTTERGPTTLSFFFQAGTTGSVGRIRRVIGVAIPLKKPTSRLDGPQQPGLLPPKGQGKSSVMSIGKAIISPTRTSLVETGWFSATGHATGGPCLLLLATLLVS